MLSILFPARPLGEPSNRYSTPDRLVVCYVLLLIGLEFRRSEFTNVIRVAMLHTLDILVPYFAFSRTVVSLADFRKALLGLTIGVLPLSLISLLEAAKSWHLYGQIAHDWGGFISVTRRDGILRAAGSAEGGITLGYLFMVAIGCVLPFWQKANPALRFLVVGLLMLFAGLVATLSRGPWVGAAVLVFVYTVMGPKPIANLGRLAIIASLVLLPLLLMPGGEKLMNILPVVGSVDAETITYRQRLFESSLAVIERNPWFGSADYLLTPEMRGMIQGEGIIDRVNSYVQIALDSGIVGLSLFVGFFASILVGLRRIFKFDSYLDLGLGDLARASLATLLAILVTIGTTSSIDFVPYVYWSFAGLCVALIRIGYSPSIRHAIHCQHETKTNRAVALRWPL